MQLKILQSYSTFITSMLLLSLLLRPTANCHGLQIPEQNNLSSSNESIISSPSPFSSSHDPTEEISVTSNSDTKNSKEEESFGLLPVEVRNNKLNVQTDEQSAEESSKIGGMAKHEEEEESSKRNVSKIQQASTTIGGKPLSSELKGKRAFSGYVGFPYRYEHVPKLSKRVGIRKTHGGPSPLSVQDAMDRDDEEHSLVALGHHGQEHHHHQHPPYHHQQPHHHHPAGRPGSHQMSQTEIDFIGILAAIAMKLVISTALASWFLVAGNSLYSIASATGTTAVFGQDSTIGYIYKTLPLVEAILRGEQNFFKRND